MIKREKLIAAIDKHRGEITLLERELRELSNKQQKGSIIRADLPLEDFKDMNPSEVQVFLTNKGLDVDKDLIAYKCPRQGVMVYEQRSE